jgi:hypothetical protein
MSAWHQDGSFGVASGLLDLAMPGLPADGLVISCPWRGSPFRAENGGPVAR